MEGALIVSVGGTPEPVAKTIAEHRPNVLCFFASQASNINVGPALARAQELIGGSWPKPRHHTVLVDDPEDLVQCYARALACAAWIEPQITGPEAVIVDYTGGTKTMTAALALATVGKGFRFSYVGGGERDKDGVGVVVTGTEVVRAGLDPWRLFAVEERRLIGMAFNAFQFDAALRVIDNLLGRNTLETPQRRWFEALRILCEGYRAWDRFEYGEALDRLRRVQRGLDTIAELGTEEEATSLARSAAEHLAFLEALRTGSDRFRKATPGMICDLIGNAERRAAEGKFDDAVARLYRATEMIAQVRFHAPPLTCSTGEVPPERIPARLRDEYRMKYLDPGTGKLRLPLYAAFRVLQAIGSTEADTFFRREADFDNLLSARNGSLLAHGVSPVRPETYQRFRALLRESFEIAEPPAFPQLALG